MTKSSKGSGSRRGLGKRIVKLEERQAVVDEARAAIVQFLAYFEGCVERREVPASTFRAVVIASRAFAASRGISLPDVPLPEGPDVELAAEAVARMKARVEKNERRVLEERERKLTEEREREYRRRHRT